MALTPEMEKIVTEAEAMSGIGTPEWDVLAICAEVLRLDAALEASEAALRKERERVAVFRASLRAIAADIGTYSSKMAIASAALAAEQETPSSAVVHPAQTHVGAAPPKRGVKP